MITYSRLGYKGNLGNQLFQIASVIGIAEKNNQKFSFPEWSYSKYFENNLPLIDWTIPFIEVREREFSFYDWDLKEGNFNLDGWLQTEKYFERDKIIETFKFKESLISDVLKRYKSVFDKKTVLVSVRRGDFVNNPFYFQISYKYYFLALHHHFYDLEERNIVFISDDVNYCKKHFSFLKNALFFEEASPIEQMVIGIHCDDYIISNSTFSWWVAWLGEKENTKVIRPIKNFRGEFATQNNDKDYFPDRWISFDEKKYKLPMYKFDLFLKGETYELLVDLKYVYKINKKKIKKIIKRIIGKE